MAPPVSTQFAVAVHVLTYLAGTDSNRPVSSTELADSVDASPVYIRRALTPLREAGLVRSTPGLKGGWALAVEPRSVTLADVWELTQGNEPSLGIHHPSPQCVTGQAVQQALVGIEQDLAAAMLDRLRTRTIATLLE